MRALSKRDLLRILPRVAEVCAAEISGHAEHGKIASALSGEGYAGGYIAALRDVEAALLHGYPSDQNGYWRRARPSPAREG